MIVVADTSPINYLVLISEIEVLPKLYDRILIPPTVCGELEHTRAPEAVRLWINQPPKWLHVRASTLPPDSHLLEADIDVGERDAILLAQELAANELLIDDMGGRHEAARRDLSVTGTIGVLRGGEARTIGFSRCFGSLARHEFSNSERASRPPVPGRDVTHGPI